MLVKSASHYSYSIPGKDSVLEKPGNNKFATKPAFLEKSMPAFAGLHILGVYNRVSFGNKPKTNPELPAMLQYLQEVKAKKGEIKSFFDLDLDKIKNICADIPVFSNLKAKDLAKITENIECILLQRGCAHKCSHCGMCAEGKITAMRWENFVELTDGIKTLKERLGFNSFILDFYSSGHPDAIYPFMDSDPMLLRMKDSQGNVHSIFDAAKLYYEQTGTKFIITTAGWDKNNAISQKAAENLAANSAYISVFSISIHPFHKDMQLSLKYEKEGNFEEAKKWRDHYIDNMCNVIKTVIGMKARSAIILEYLEKPNPEDKGLGIEDSKKLLKEIFNKLKDEGVDVSHFYKKNNILKREILPLGRAIKYFSLPDQLAVQKKSKTLHAPDGEYSTSIAPDGKILVRNAHEGKMTNEPYMETKYSLNFSVPTENKYAPLVRYDNF